MKRLAFPHHLLLSKFTDAHRLLTGLLFLALGLSGCVAGGGVDPARRGAAKRIGVVSALGDEVHGRTAGSTIFETKNHHGSAPDFLVDTAASAAAIQALGAANPGAQIINLQGERGSIRLPESRAIAVLPESNFATGRVQILEEAARRLGKQHQLDLVVLVVPWPQAQREVNSVPDEGGYGYAATSLFGLNQRDMVVYANYAVGAFDGTTGQRLGLRPGNAHRPAPGVKWHGPVNAYSTGDRATLGESLRLMIGEEVFKQLRLMGLSS